MTVPSKQVMEEFLHIAMKVLNSNKKKERYGNCMRYEEFTIEGRNAVIEAFRSGKTIDKIYVLDGCQDGPMSTIRREARKHDTMIKYVDKDRLGCVGASFGGFSVYWLAGHHNKRFKAFIAHDGIFNMEMQYLETEEKWFANWDMGGAYWDKQNKTAQRTFANSPHLFVDKWDAPILCIHGEKDFRILANQSMAAFDAANAMVDVCERLAKKQLAPSFELLTISTDSYLAMAEAGVLGDDFAIIEQFKNLHDRCEQIINEYY